MSNPFSHSPYAILGVTAAATPEVIRRAFLERARQLHPDINPSPQAAEQMRQVLDAYALLRAQSTPALNTTQNVASTGIVPTFTSPPTQGDTIMETRSLTAESRRNGAMAIALPIVPQSFHQLGIFVLDGSGSMSDTVSGGAMSKADAVNGALRDLLTRFKVSRQKSNFSFAVVAFDEEASVHLDITPATGVDDNADYNPQDGHGGGTFIGGGLEAARGIAERFLASARPDIPASVIIVVMSDGECATPDTTVAIANAVKRVERVTLCATHFASIGQSDPAAQATLKQIASDPVRGYKTVYDAESLRAFFLASMSAGRNV